MKMNLLLKDVSSERKPGIMSAIWVFYVLDSKAEKTRIHQILFIKAADVFVLVEEQGGFFFFFRPPKDFFFPEFPLFFLQRKAFKPRGRFGVPQHTGLHEMNLHHLSTAPRSRHYLKV